MSKRTRHDTFFHEMVQFASFRQKFVSFHLKAEDGAELDLDYLEPMPESFMRSHKTVVPDCVLRAPLKRARGWGYIIVEQETNPNKKELLTRLEVAKARIFEYDFNDPSSEVPPLIRAIIFCTGRKRWTRELDPYAALPEGLRERVRRSLGEPPRVVHASDLKDDEELTRSCPELVMAHRLFQSAREDPVAVIGELEPLLSRVLRRKGGASMLQAMVDYVFPGDGHEQADAFILGVERVLTRADVRRVVMSFSEIFRHEGKQLGLQEGLQKGLERGKLAGKLEGKQLGLKEGLERGLEKGKLETARNMLRKGMSVATITEVTGLPRQKLTVLRKKQP